jgi:hypothetical protein
MIGRVLAGAALALAAATSAMAAGPLQVSTHFPYSLGGVGDPYAADLATVGVTQGLDTPDVQPAGPTTLEFRLLEADIAPSGFQIFSLDLGGVSYAVTPQAFNATGTLLATVTTGANFSTFVGFTDTFGPEPPLFIWGSIPVYLSDADTAALTGIGPFIGDVDHLYFSTGGHALFEVNVAHGVPEPAAWALMIAGFGLAGAQLRRRGARRFVA